MNARGILATCVLAVMISVASLGAASSKVADAAQKLDKAALRVLLAQKEDVNAPQPDGTAAIHWAAFKDDLEMADLLIRSGAKAGVANSEGITPLALASLNGNAAMIDRLLKAGADPKMRGPNGETTLMMAARNGNPDAIKALLAAGVDVNAKENLRGTTALMWAAEQEHPDAVKALVAGGADVSARSAGTGVPKPYLANVVRAIPAGGRQTPAAGAARSDGDAPAGLDTPAGNRSGRNTRGGGGQAAPPDPANTASTNDNADDGADAPVAGNSGGGGGGLTALVFAARQGDIESARILIAAKADVNQVTEFGWSPLLTAVQNRRYQLARLLIEHGANVNLANKHKWTPLYLATDNRNIEGGDYPVPKPDMDHLEFIRFLLDHGANVNARVAEDGQPGAHTTETRTIFTMQWFFEEGATPLVRAAQSGDVTLMKLLLAHGADPKIPTTFGDTALAAAAGIGWVEGVTHEQSPQDSVEAVRLLLGLGLNPNSVNRDGRTPLMAAGHKGRTEVIRLLVDHGARLETRDRGSRDTSNVDLSGHGGWQALDYADGLVRVGVQSALPHPEAAALFRELMVKSGLPVPPVGRKLDGICAAESPLCTNK